MTDLFSLINTLFCLSNRHLSEKLRILLIDKPFLCKFECSVTIHKSTKFDIRHFYLILRVCFEDLKMKPIVNLRICCIETHVQCHIKITVKFYVFRTHVNWTDWWMMRYLFQINSEITELSLIRLSQNGVKRFLNTGASGRDKHESTSNQFYLFDQVSFICCSGQIVRQETQTFSN